MSTFVLIHGGGSTAWDWHLVGPLLEGARHRVIAADLPTEDPAARFDDCVRAVADAVGDAPTDALAGKQRQTIVVGHSLGGFIAPLVAEALAADGLVYLAGMIPKPDETFMDWWTNTGHDKEDIDDDPAVSFFNDVPDALADEARRRERDQQGAWLAMPWPADQQPDVPTRVILCTEDQFFPAPFMRRQADERLRIAPVEIPGGHYAMLTDPDAVATALDDFARELRDR